MDKRIKKIFAYVLLVFSVMFCCVSVMNSAYAYRNGNEKEFKPIDNIGVKTVNNKMQEVEQVDTKCLEYEEGISKELEMDVYTDYEGNAYIYNEKNELVSYAINHLAKNDETTLKMSKKEALDYGKKYLKEMVEDASRYSLQEISYNTYNNTYDIIFGHKVCGIKTLDIVYLSLQNNGNLVYYSIPALNVFDTIEISPKYKMQINRQVKEQLEDLSDSSLVSYKIDDIILAYDDEEFRYNVSVTYIINQNGEDVEIGDTLFCHL